MYKRDYVFAEDLFGSIDLDIMHDCRKLYVYVGGKDLKSRIYLYYRIFMIIHHICSEDIKNRTIEMLERYCFASRLLRKTYLDKCQNNCECILPYEMFYISSDGEIWLCPCFGKLIVSDLIGNTPEEAWNSTIANIMRLSIENNTYTFCDRRCKEFRGNKDSEALTERKKIKLPKEPSKILIAFDAVCNLKCKSCRTKPYVKNCYEIEQTILYYADALNKSGWLETCDELSIGGNGETFMSKGYKKVLFEDASCVRKKVSIMTNGKYGLSIQIA